MSTLYLIQIIVTFSAIIFQSDATKSLKSQPEFRDPVNWLNQKPPCEADKVLFPSNTDSVVGIPSGLNLNGIILPANGAILFEKNSEYAFLDEPQNKSGCKNNDRIAKFVQPKLLFWFDPKSWINVDVSPATPDVEKIPCTNENVQFGNGNNINVDLENVDNLNIGSVLAGGRETVARVLERFFKTEIGQLVFSRAESTRVAPGPSTCACHGPDVVANFEMKVCSHVGPCLVPKCLNPVVPLGHCCALCGAVMRLELEDCHKFDSLGFNAVLQQALATQGVKDKIYSHTSFVQEGSASFFQVIVMDVEEYSGISVNFVKEFEKEKLKASFGNVKAVTSFSGRSYTPYTGPSPFTIIFLTFIIVIAFFGVIYDRFGREKPSITLPRWLTISRYRVFRSPFVFARFENHPTDVEVRANVVVAGDYDNQRATEAPSTGTTSFNNPMFCEQEIKSVQQPVRAQAAGDENDGTGTDQYFDHAPLEEEEMIEVDLGSEISATSSK